MTVLLIWLALSLSFALGWVCGAILTMRRQMGEPSFDIRLDEDRQELGDSRDAIRLVN